MSCAVDPLEPFRLDGRAAIVTGASSGLGERFARVLHAAGAKVVMAARRVDRLERLAEELPGSLAVPCDVADDGDLERLVGATVEAHGRIDVLVNNAGMTYVGPAEDEPPSEFRRVLDVNLTAVFVLSQLAGRVMLEQGSGSIVNIASVFGLVAPAQMLEASYPASKGGVVNLTRDLAAQWARRGVRVNAIAPGFFRTEINEELLSEERGVAAVRRRTPMGRVGEAHELDGALLFLASEASSYVTGHVLAVDGGWTAI